MTSALKWRLGVAVALAATLTLLVAVCAAVPSQAYAGVTKQGTGIVQLSHLYDDLGDKPGKVSASATYKKADVTNDGKKDKVQMLWKGDQDGDAGKGVIAWSSATLKVNGKTIKTWKNGQIINIITLKNKKSFIELDSGLYQIKSNKLKKVVNLDSLISPKALGKTISDSYAMAESVKGNTIYCYCEFRTKALGWLCNADSAHIKIVYSKGKFKLKSSTIKLVDPYLGDEETGEDIDYYTAKKTIKAKKSKTSSTTSVVIKKGQTFKATKASISKGKIYVKVKAENGKTGWVKLGKSQLVQVKS